jgi:hypothetical protein
MGKGALNGQNAKSQTLKDLGPEKKSAPVSNMFKSSSVSTIAPGTIILWTW